MGFAILCGIVQTNRLRLDGNTRSRSYPYCQDLLFHLAVSQPTTKLNQPVGNGGFRGQYGQRLKKFRMAYQSW